MTLSCIGAEAAIAASVHVHSLYSIEDRAIAYRYAAHFDAAIKAIDAALGHAQSEYLAAAQQWPDVLSASRGLREDGREFNLSDGRQHVMPYAHQTDLGRLPRPKLEVGSDGYTYLHTHHYVMIDGLLRVDGTTGRIEMEINPTAETE
jgi:hypothetical protein